MRRVSGASGFLSFSAMRRFARRDDGAAAIMFGLMVVPLMLSAGAAIDYGQAWRARSSLQTSVDAAALAAASAYSKDGNPAQVAETYVRHSFSYESNGVTTRTTVDAATGMVTVQASSKVPTSLMKIARIDFVPVSASATAAIGAGQQKMELAIALDTTASMQPNGKLDTAKAAAKDLINRVMVQKNGAVNPNVRAGLVPFAEYVNVGTQYAGADWLTDTADIVETQPKICRTTYPNAVYGLTERVTQTCYNDGVPYECTYEKWDIIASGEPVEHCQTPVWTYKWKGCVGSQPSPDDEDDLANAAKKVPALHSAICSNPLIRLGNDKAAIDAAIDALQPSGETYIAPGLLWGWRLLSHRPPFGDGSGVGGAKKVLVLMTDGANTRSPIYPWHAGSDVTASNDKLFKVCAAVKRAGITLYTIAFQVTDPTIQNILSQCASGVPYYYNASTNAELQSAFGSIGSQLTNLRLVR